jgi:hypothetical protein
MGKVYSIKNSWTSHFENKSYLGIGKAGDEEIPDHHTPLITHEIWDAVQKIQAEKRPGHGGMLHYRRTKNPSLLSGLSFCIHCGAAMVVHAEKDYRSYACGKRERQRGYKDCQNARRDFFVRYFVTIDDPAVAVSCMSAGTAFVGQVENQIALGGAERFVERLHAFLNQCVVGIAEAGQLHDAVGARPGNRSICGKRHDSKV